MKTKMILPILGMLIVQSMANAADEPKTKPSSFRSGVVMISTIKRTFENGSYIYKDKELCSARIKIPIFDLKSGANLGTEGSKYMVSCEGNLLGTKVYPSVMALVMNSGSDGENLIKNSSTGFEQFTNRKVTTVMGHLFVTVTKLTGNESSMTLTPEEGAAYVKIQKYMQKSTSSTFGFIGSIPQGLYINIAPNSESCSYDESQDPKSLCLNKEEFRATIIFDADQK